MRKLFVVKNNEAQEVEIRKESWDAFVEDGMPGKLLGDLRIYRENLEKEARIPHEYSAVNGKVDIISEVVLCVDYLLTHLNAQRKVLGDNQNLEDWFHGMFESCYMLIADEYKCENIVVDVDNNFIYDESIVPIHKYMHEDRRNYGTV